MGINLSWPKGNPHGGSKLTDEALIELHFHGLSIRKLAEQLGVSRRQVCSRMKRLGLEATCKGGRTPSYEKVGTDKFRCAVCEKVKRLRQRHGRKCRKCDHDHWVSTLEGALRFRFAMKKHHARRKGITFALPFEDFKGLYQKQAGRDGYTGQQMAFDFGQGRSGATVSLDRIDNEKGYTPDNVIFCRLDTNSKKNDQPKDQFMKQLALEFPEGGSISLG
jgi:AraC-like DNA-binding protein